jgi:outer membrane lipoprotein-sorting protein
MSIMKKLKSGHLAFLGAGLLAATANGQGADPGEIMKKMTERFYYAGKSFRSDIKMRIQSQDGKERLRDLSMLRLNMPEPGVQRYFMYFHSPEDVRRMAFLVNKYPEKEDDRWLFIPSLEMVQRIAARDAGSSFAGSDFTYEDISGRDLGSDIYKFLREENVGDRPCFVIESTPRTPASYKQRISWIDKGNYLPLKEEYRDLKGEAYREFTADEVGDVGGIPTILKRTMKNLKTRNQTRVELSGTQYDIKLEAGEFNERSFRNPPRSWIQ